MRSSFSLSFSLWRDSLPLSLSLAQLLSSTSQQLNGIHRGWVKKCVKLKENMHNLFSVKPHQTSEIPGELMISFYAWNNSTLKMLGGKKMTTKTISRFWILVETVPKNAFGNWDAVCSFECTAMFWESCDKVKRLFFVSFIQFVCACWLFTQKQAQSFTSRSLFHCGSTSTTTANPKMKWKQWRKIRAHRSA